MSTMNPKQQPNFDITFQTLLSLLGLILVAILTAFPPNVSGNIPWRKPLVGSIFSAICVLGVFAVFWPTQCSTIFRLKKTETTNKTTSDMFASHTLSSSQEGHHPRCGKFAAHVLQIRDKAFCAACTGLLFGGLFALAGALLYFFGSWQVIVQNGSMILVFGILGVGFGLFQFIFSDFVRLLLNTFFVLGALLILIGIDLLVNSLVLDLFVISLILFWLFTRISLSHWDHRRICSKCDFICCELAS